MRTAAPGQLLWQERTATHRDKQDGKMARDVPGEELWLVLKSGERPVRPGGAALGWRAGLHVESRVWEELGVK